MLDESLADIRHRVLLGSGVGRMQLGQLNFAGVNKSGGEESKRSVVRWFADQLERT